MASEHYVKYINDAIELMIYSEGAFSWTDIENMSIDELPYIIYTFKTQFEKKQESKNAFIKACFEFATQGLNQILKGLGKLGGGK